MSKSKFIDKNKKIYKKLKPCYCPALQDTVHFTSRGLQHILYNRRRPRSHNERHYRSGLIPHLTSVIKNSSQAVLRVKSEKPLIVTWELAYSCKVNGRTHLVQVIVIKEGAGKLECLSTMSAPEKQKTPNK